MNTPSDELALMLAQLRAPLPPVRRPMGYWVGLVTTSLVAVLMPVVYLGLIAGVGGVCWWHLTNNWFLVGMASHGINGILIALLAYLGPVLAGATMMVFMVRPLLVRTQERPESRVLGPDEAPEFTALVHAVADAVGAPRPAEIRFDSQVNASASFRDGFWGWLKGELTLTVGLPLIEGMNTRELVGILSHEFGHFAQGGGMRLTFLVRVLIYWFQRVVNHRDGWDQKLDSTAKQSDIRIGVFFHLARFFVAGSRLALSAVSRLSHLACVSLLRAMEYDADRHEARVAGSEQFPKTAHHLRRLGLAWQKANGEAARAWSDGALPRDFTAYVGHLEQRLDAEVDQRLAEGIKEEKKNLWATHPRDIDRNARALAAAEAGIFNIERPCRTLFPTFRSLTEAGSDVYYSARLGQPVDPAKYQATDDILRSSEEMRLDHEAYRAAVGPWAGLLLPLNFYLHEADADLPVDDATARAEVEAARAGIDEANSVYDQTYAAVKERACYLSGQKAGYRVDQLLEKGKDQELDLVKVTAELQVALAPVHRRFARALSQIEGEASTHCLVHRKLAEASNILNAWQLDFAALNYLVHQEDNQRGERWNEIQRLLGRNRDVLISIESLFAGQPYLFSEGQRLTVAEYLFGGPVASLDEPNLLFSQTGQALDRASQLYTRTLGRLARLGNLVPQ